MTDRPTSDAAPWLDDLENPPLEYPPAEDGIGGEQLPPDNPADPLDPSTALAVVELAHGTRSAALAWRDPDTVARHADDLRARVLESVRVLADEARARRRTEGKVTSSTVAAELALLGDAYDALSAVSSAIGDGAEETRKIAGEIVLDVEPEREIGTASVRVGDGHGRDLKVTRSQASKASVRDDDVVDVIVAALLLDARDEEARAIAAGARAAIAQLRELVGPLGWKTTALDGFAKTLEDREKYDLAIRLGHAYGRVSVGEAKTKIERVERSKR